MSQADRQVQPPPFVALALTAPERAQIEAQLSTAFGLSAEAARVWVQTTAQRGVCFGRVERDGAIAASYAAETLTLARGGERLTAVMLQSCYVHPVFRGRGYGLARSDVAEVRRRFAADAVVLTLFDDGLAPYWRRRGFEVVQRAEVVGLPEYLRRATSAFSPALSGEAIVAKLAENVADGATVAEITTGIDDATIVENATGTEVGAAGGRLLLVRYPGDDVVEELIVSPRSEPVASRGANLATPESAGMAMTEVLVRLKTVMASPGDLDLVCAIDL